MKTQKNGLPLQIEGYPINIDKNKRNFKVFLQHRNGDQTINGWFTYDDAVKEIPTSVHIGCKLEQSAPPA